MVITYERYLMDMHWMKFSVTLDLCAYIKSWQVFHVKPPKIFLFSPHFQGYVIWYLCLYTLCCLYRHWENQLTLLSNDLHRCDAMYFSILYPSPLSHSRCVDFCWSWNRNLVSVCLLRPNKIKKEQVWKPMESHIEYCLSRNQTQFVHTCYMYAGSKDVAKRNENKTDRSMPSH